MIRKIRRFSSLPLAEATIFPFMVLASLAADLALRWVPLPVLARRLGPLARFLPFTRRLRPQRLFALADRATRITHGRKRCLPRSLLLQTLLGGHERRVELRIGIAREGASLDGHAWVETEDGALGEEPRSFERFDVLLRLPVTP